MECLFQHNNVYVCDRKGKEKKGYVIQMRKEDACCSPASWEVLNWCYLCVALCSHCSLAHCDWPFLDSVTDSVHCERPLRKRDAQRQDSGWWLEKTWNIRAQCCALKQVEVSPPKETEDLPRVICAVLWLYCSRRIIQIQVLSGREKILTVPTFLGCLIWGKALTVISLGIWFSISLTFIDVYLKTKIL